MRLRCGASCTSGSSACVEDGCGGTYGLPSVISPPVTGCPPTSGQNPLSAQTPQGEGHQMSTRGSMVSTTSSASKPSSAFVSLAGLIADTSLSKEPVTQRVRVGLVMQLMRSTGCNFELHVRVV